MHVHWPIGYTIIVQNHGQMLLILILVFMNVAITISYIHTCNFLLADLTSRTYLWYISSLQIIHPSARSRGAR